MTKKKSSLQEIQVYLEIEISEMFFRSRGFTYWTFYGEASGTKSAIHQLIFLHVGGIKQ